MNATNNTRSPKIRGKGLVSGDVEQITNKNPVDLRQNNFLKAIEILQSLSNFKLVIIGKYLSNMRIIRNASNNLNASIIT